MLKSQKFLFNGLMLTATSLIMRTVGVAFNAYTANAIGEAGTGLFSLVMSVYSLAVTAACAGINLAATRMTAEADGRFFSLKVRRVMRKCIVYSLVTGISAAVLLFSFSGFIGERLLCSEDTIPSLKILSFSLPFIALTSAFNGYFTAVRRVFKTAFAQILEQALKIALTVAGLRMFYGMGVKYQCLALVAGSGISELLSFFIIGFMYLFDIFKNQKMDKTDTAAVSAGDGGRILRQLLSITVPVALSSFIRSALVTVEHILIPYGLKKSGASFELALSSYGTLHGMVMPIILFPACFIYSFYGLLVPELAQSKELGENGKIVDIVSRMFRFALMFAVGVSGVMLCFSQDIGLAVYGSPTAASYIKVMAPLIPIMYLDSAVDAMLKGLGEQRYSMRVNIADAALSTLCVYLLVPRFGIGGYIFVVYISEVFNLSLSAMRLIKSAGFRIDVRSALLPLFSACGACCLTNIVFGLISADGGSYAAACTAKICTCLIFYIILLLMLDCINGEDRKAIRILLPIRRNKVRSEKI